MSAILLHAVLLSAATTGVDFESGKYEWVFKIEGQTQRLKCDIEVTGDTFVLRSGKKDPLPGKISKDLITFGIDNDANFMKGTGKLNQAGWVQGDMELGQGGRAFVKGTFIFAPINTAEQIKAVDAYFMAARPKLALPEKSTPPEPKDYPAQELADTLGKLQIDVPKLGGNMKFSQPEISPVTKLFRFEFESGDIAVLVSTKIRDDWPKDDSTLLRIEPRFKQTQEQFGADLCDVRLVGKAPQRMLGVSLVNPADSPFFPMSLGSSRSDTLNAVAVSHLFVKSGRVVECAIIGKNFGGEERDALVSRVSALVTQWRQSLKVIEP